jgi:hypothetical protein
MAKTGAERQRKHYMLRKAANGGLGRGKVELTMRRLFVYLYAHGDTRASELYSKFHGSRDKQTWHWLMDEITQNALYGDVLAPVTKVGTGSHGNAVYLRLSDKWDIERDWDKEQAEKAAQLNPAPINPLDIEPF